ncbi:mRNA cap guanine-N7 methyltransferase [Apiospora kogelbergensis]|uniref:mRNA cap guanine-N7 methyltransferase n=1 Tax=Apiospora kogelbergensis TaxID=1337665 RepID=UPI00312E3406
MGSDERSPARASGSGGGGGNNPRRGADENDDAQPEPFDARKLQPAKKRQRSRSPSDPAPRKQKRPGRGARMTQAQIDEIKNRQAEREREAAAAAAQTARGAINDVVRQHYNAVPERGRDWRKKDSNIKGLRVFNNWVKSTIIQKFSPTRITRRERTSEGATWPGGDLGKWQQAPQNVALYVGLDPAEVSIDQAQDRYRNMSSRGGGGRGGRGGHRGGRPPRLYDAFFHVKDCFGTSLGDIDVIQKTEEKARRMLENVSNSLKKGGRFLGCIPNSDIIGERVTEFNERMAAKKASAATGEPPSSDDKEEGEAEETAEWGNEMYRVRFPGKTPADGVFRPPFGWKYSFFLSEAVEEVPEYVVPWPAFRALAEDYNLELQYHQSFKEIWESEKDDRILGPLSERMGVRERGGGPLLVTPEEMEVANFYLAFCFYKV